MVEFLIQCYQFIFVDLQSHLQSFAQLHGTWIYGLLFAIVFCETGLVVTPFLPGDSLLFAGGAVAALEGGVSVHEMAIVLFAAAVLGDAANYWIGHWVGPKAFSGKIRFLKKEHMDRTQAFFEKYGSKTIIIARFVPIVRTFAPFVAGIGKMHYPRFLMFNAVGGFLWVLLFVYTGYFFGTRPWVQKNFTYVIFAIIFLSLLPMVYEYWVHLRKKSRANRTGTSVEPNETLENATQNEKNATKS